MTDWLVSVVVLLVFLTLWVIWMIKLWCYKEKEGKNGKK